jgi:hypothetical protein
MAFRKAADQQSAARVVPRPQAGWSCPMTATLDDFAQVYARYIAGLPKVNHRAYTKPVPKPHHQTYRHQTLAVRPDLQRSPVCRDIPTSPTALGELPKQATRGWLSPDAN